VFIAAGVFAWNAFRPAVQEGLPPAGSPQAIMAFNEADPRAPTLTVTVGGATHPATLGTHSYSFDGGKGFFDALPPTFVAADAISVVRGTPLLIANAPPTVAISANGGLVMNDGAGIDLSEPGAAFDLPLGTYLLIIDAHWDDAQAQFWLPIEVVDETSLSPTQPVPSVVPPGVSETAILPAAWHLVVAYGSVWIAGANGVDRVNAETGRIEAEIDVPQADESDITAGAGHVWVTTRESIVGIDATTDEVDRHFEIQTGIREIVFANDHLYVGHSREGNGDLTEIDPITGAIGRGILTGGPGLGESDILATGDAFWVGYSSPASGGTSSGLIRVEPDLSRADPVVGVDGVFSLAEADGFIWAVGTEALYKIDADGTLVDTFPIPLAGKVASDGERLWMLLVTGSTSATIYLPDPNVPARIVEVDTGSGALLGEGTALPHEVPANIAAGDGTVWVSFYEAGALVGVDTGSATDA
jgi:DNA-binding beta-propeller fold protein YncE